MPVTSPHIWYPVVGGPGYDLRQVLMWGPYYRDATKVSVTFLTSPTSPCIFDAAAFTTAKQASLAAEGSGGGSAITTTTTITSPGSDSVVPTEKAAATAIANAVAGLVNSGTFNNPTLRDVQEVVQVLGSQGPGTLTINCALGNPVSFTVAGALTIAFSNVPVSGMACTMTLIITNGGAFTVTWPSGLKWQGAAATALTVSGKDIIDMVTTDGGTTWLVTGLQNFA